jgi:preprotein translocase subunit SecE
MADNTQKKGIVAFVKRIGLKIGKTFLDIRSELKKVIWPDRRKLISSTMTVVGICIVFGAAIWAVDGLLSFVLKTIGFFDAKTSYATPTPTVAVTSTVTPTSSATPAVTVTLTPAA